MNFRNYTHGELVNYISTAQNRNNFIKAAKELTTRVYNDELISKSQCEAKCETEFERGVEMGRLEMRDECREEMANAVSSLSAFLNHKEYERLLSYAQTIG